MESQQLWLRLRDGKKNLLFARGETHYFFIDVNKNMNRDAELFLTEFGASDENLKLLQLSFQAVPIKQFRGIALGGTCGGSAIYMYLKGGERKQYTLFESYDERMIEAIFPDVERFTPPKTRAKHFSKEDRWRADNRDKRILIFLEWVNGLLCVAGGICAIAYIVKGHWLPLLGCYLVCAAYLCLDILFPAYVTFVPEEKQHRKKKIYSINLAAGVTVPTVLLVLAIDLDYLFQWKTYLYALAVSVAVSLMLRHFAEEFRRDKNAIAIVFIYTWLMAVIWVGNCNVGFDFTEPEAVYTLPVEDLYRTRGRRSNYRYYCTVILPDGEKRDIRISKPYYETLSEGDPVQVEFNEGCLGIEYVEISEHRN